MKEEEQKSIVIYKSWKKPLRKLSLEQKGRIFDALLDFPDPPDFEDDQKLEMAWDFMSEAVESNSKNGTKDEKRELLQGVKAQKLQTASVSKTRQIRQMPTLTSKNSKTRQIQL